MATRRRSGVDDEERGRAFIGFDDCTVSRGIDESESGRNEGGGGGTSGRGGLQRKNEEFDEWLDETRRI